MIKNDPQRKGLRRLALFYGIVFLLGLLVFGLQVTGRAAYQNILSPLLLLILLLFLVGWFGYWLLRFPRVNKRRARALQGDQRLLAASQPVPDENALSLPTTLQLHPRRRYFLAMSGIVAVFAVIGSFTGSSFSETLPALAIELAIVLITFLIFTHLILRPRLQYDLEVNEHGLSVTHNNVRTAVKWSDARFFAVNDPKKPKRAKVYELATSETVARWLWLPPGMTFSYAFYPPLPLEEYHRQQAVLQLIEAKTHLPLYDIGPSKAK